MLTYHINVTGSDGSQATVTGDPKAVDSVELALAYMGAGWNPDVQTWDFGFYKPAPALLLYKVAGAIIEAQRTKGRVPAKMVDDLAKAVCAAVAHVNAARDESEAA